MNKLIVTKNFETFDFERYERLSKKNPFNISEFLDDGTYIEMSKTNFGLSYRETPPDSYFAISKRYYKNGNIASKGLDFNWSFFQKGIHYQFDERGKLINEINYDKPYSFTFEQVLQFCKKEGIPVDKGPVLKKIGYHTKIKRKQAQIQQGKSWWIIQWFKKPDITEEINLNGITGEILSRTTEEQFPNNSTGVKQSILIKKGTKKTIF